MYFHAISNFNPLLPEYLFCSFFVFSSFFAFSLTGYFILKYLICWILDIKGVNTQQQLMRHKVKMKREKRTLLIVW